MNAIIYSSNHFFLIIIVYTDKFVIHQHRFQTNLTNSYSFITYYPLRVWRFTLRFKSLHINFLQ